MKTLSETAIEKYRKKLEQAEAKRLRSIRNGTYIKKTSKKIQHWYSTRVLKDWVEERMAMFDDGRVRINCKWVMQIRGKHMRRLKKKMKIKQVGRYIVRDE